MRATQKPGQPHSGLCQRLLAVKLADIGDMLSITPALQALRAAHPQARIDLLAHPSSASILEGAPYVDRVIPFDKLSFSTPRQMIAPRRVTSMLAFLARLRMEHYDCFAIFHHPTTRWGAWERALLAWAVHAPATAGLDNSLPHARALRKRLTHPVPDRGFGARHEAEYWLDVAARLGADSDGQWKLHIPVSPTHESAASMLLAAEGLEGKQPLVAIHPGAGAYSLARLWPVERFAEVARALSEEHGAHVLVVGGPDEEELAAQLVELAGLTRTRIRSVAGRTSIQVTAALLARCDLFVGGDSGPMHIAAAVGTPVVAVFGPSNKEAWGPYTPPGEESPHTIVWRGLPCQPCFYRGLSLGLREGCGPRPCLTGLEAAPVIAGCARALSASSRLIS